MFISKNLKQDILRLFSNAYLFPLLLFDLYMVALNITLQICDNIILTVAH